MKNIKRVLFIMALALTCGAYGSMAQIYVNVRPPMPRYERVVAPSPRHVWIDEDWEPRGNSYAFVGGHWAEPPRRGARWQGGSWSHTKHGHQWKPGRWH